MTITKKQARLWWISLAWTVIGVLVTILIILVLVLGWLIYSKDRALMGVTLIGEPVEHKTQNEIVMILRDRVVKTNREIIISDDDRNWTVSWVDLKFAPDIQASAENAVSWGKKLPTFLSLGKLINGNINLELSYAIDENEINNIIGMINEEIYTEAVDPEIRVDDKGEISVIQGTLGRTVDSVLLKQLIIANLIELNSNNTINLPVIEDDRRIPDIALEKMLERAKKWKNKNLVLNHEDIIINWEGSFVAGLIGGRTVFDELKLDNAIELVSTSVQRDPKDAVLVFEEQANKVKEFSEEKYGLELQKEEFKNLIIRELMLLENSSEISTSVNLPVVTVAPKISVRDINNLGIKERIGRGESYFKGSINSRMHNIEIASSKLNGVIIPPGEEFSFVESIGEISQKTGYQQAYVIYNGQTVLGDGGGVCQVSSTIFRTALYTGVNITKRLPHSYRVSYYEQKAFPGLDATIYPPDVDFKFLNDTPAHILIQTQFDRQNAHLVIDFYGTSDGRVSEVGNNRMWDIIAPPADLYIDDPTLPIGVVKQQEQRINGAKAAFDWKVTRGGEILYEKTFVSVYRPWQAVYMRGTKGN